MAGTGEGLPCGVSSATPRGKGGGDKLPYFCMLFPPPLSPLPPGEGKIYFLRFHQSCLLDFFLTKRFTSDIKPTNWSDYTVWSVYDSRYKIEIFMDTKQKRLNQKRWGKAIGIGRVAAKLFNEKGYLETSMDDIAAAANLSKGGIYHYFFSKNEILYFISTNYMDLLLKDLEQDLKKREDSFFKIRFIISRHIDLYTKYTSEAKTTLHEAHLLSPEYFKKYAEKERRYYRIVANALSGFFINRIQKGQLRVITFTLLGMCNWIYRWYKPKRSVSPQELSEIISDIFCKGVVGYEMKGKAK